MAAMMATTHDNLAWFCFKLEDNLLEQIKNRYDKDPIIIKLHSATTGMHNIHCDNGYWFVDNCLFILNIPQVRESLFHIAHDTIGHFGSQKSYASLRDAYYWLNMH
jgi:integrase-like protein